MFLAHTEILITVFNTCNTFFFNLQWFGNLVTMEWWNDLWLNEGFASFMEFMGVNHTQPDWKMMELSIYENFQGAMSEDQLSNSHPIMAEVKDPAQINALFDSISYDKVDIRFKIEILKSCYGNYIGETLELTYRSLRSCCVFSITKTVSPVFRE